ncbi:hypothetical protein AAC387_Pa11g0280 [Persea americana]
MDPISPFLQVERRHLQQLTPTKGQGLEHYRLKPGGQLVTTTYPTSPSSASATTCFGGQIPINLTRRFVLKVIDLYHNQLVVEIPRELSMLPNLVHLYLGVNNLTGDEVYGPFLDKLAVLGGLKSLQRLSFNSNRLRSTGDDNNLLIGALPSSLANLSMRLTNLHLENNLIFGSIPVGIENLASLNLLSLQGNLLTGSLPIGIGKLVKFEALALFTNKLSGQIPSSIGNLMRLSRLVLFEIDFEGGLPPSIGGRRYLESLDLPVNDHSGTIPREVLTISSTTR